MGDYRGYLLGKSQANSLFGFKPNYMPDSLMDFQSDLVDWSIEKGRGALFADCGLGKTLMQLVWAENVHRHTNKGTLVLTPLAVSPQTVGEASKFDIEAYRSMDGKPKKGITVTNFEKLHLFDSDDYSGVVVDESSILKSFDGKTKERITEFVRKMKYRLLCTATAAPNDYIELGTSSEALGYMGHVDMLNKFFRNDLNNTAQGRAYGQVLKWRLKGHAEIPFWRWVCSWARAIRKPSDIGYEDGAFKLPPLIQKEYEVISESLPEGMMFALPAVTLNEQREERNRTLNERCEKVAELVSGTGKPALVWCSLNKEGHLLEKMIAGSVQVSGSDSDEKKEDLLTGFAKGNHRVLITKPKIGAWGLNYQHCSHVTFFPSHSFEQFYQGVRRCWRFGQKNPVQVDIITTEGERRVLSNLKRKSAAAEKMFENLNRYMNNPAVITSGGGHDKTQEIPSWA